MIKWIKDIYNKFEDNASDSAMWIFLWGCTVSAIFVLVIIGYVIFEFIAWLEPELTFMEWMLIPLVSVLIIAITTFIYTVNKK